MMVYSALHQRKVSLSGTNCKLREELLRSIYRRFINSCSRLSGIDHPYGSVYNLEFTPSLNTVLASHANKALTLYDTRLETKVSTIADAHNDGVNVITFLDPCLFATGSDDETIRIWDLRKLSNPPVAILRGHKGWVKNVEVDRKSNNLFSVAFNDGVRKWNLNRLDSYETDTSDNLLFDMAECVRLRLTYDASLMVISLRKDHLLFVSNFDGNTVDAIRNRMPSNFPLSPEDKERLDIVFGRNRKNVCSVHVINKLYSDNFRTPLSIAFHPGSKLLGMRVVDVKGGEFAQELTFLYDADIGACSYKDVAAESSQNFLKYVDEKSPDSVIDFIKEISFSQDGRILVSPYRNKVRLLAVDYNCTPMDAFYDSRYYSIEKSLCCCDFEEVVVCGSHADGVLTCRLNSNDMCLASGCIDGEVMFNWPRL